LEVLTNENSRSGWRERAQLLLSQQGGALERNADQIRAAIDELRVSQKG
jgi:hypothetical protein